MSLACKLKIFTILVFINPITVHCKSPVPSQNTYPNYISGGLVGTVVGFGTGHALQGRFMDKGWLFAVGELGSLLIATQGCGGRRPPDEAVPCALAGTAGFLTFKIGEIINVWMEPNPSSENSEAIFIFNPFGKTLALGWNF